MFYDLLNDDNNCCLKCIYPTVHKTANAYSIFWRKFLELDEKKKKGHLHG